MRYLIFILFALLTAVPGIGASPSPSDSPGSLPDGLYAKINTPRGTIIARLFVQEASMTVTNFVGLTEGSLANRILDR